MTEPTYTEAELREAWYSQDELTWKEFKDYLKRPKHDFAEGQVYYWANLNEEAYFDYTHEDCDQAIEGGITVRHLNMTELGPHVKALRDALLRMAYGDVGQGGYDPVYCPFADKAIKAFDKAVGEEE